MTSPPTVTVVIASPLEPEHVERIRAVDERLEVLYEPSFLATPRYVADHGGELPELSAEQDRRWHAMQPRQRLRRRRDLGWVIVAQRLSGQKLHG